MIKKISAYLLISFGFAGLAWPQQLEMKSATVAGFINRGKSSQDNINILMTKSLSTFLSKISKNITPYKDVEEIAGGTNFWGQKALDGSRAINIAQHFSTEQVITGDYLVNDKNSTIVIDVLVYNVINGQVLFKRNYKGNAGPEIFDTVDKMILDVSGLLVGKTISLGYFKLDIKPENVKYRLFVNNSFIKLVDSRNGYFDRFISGQSIDISLKPEKSDEETLRKIIEIKSGTNELEFNPSGVLILETMKEGVDVYLNGIKTGKTDSSGELKIPNIGAGKENAISLKKGDTMLSETNISIKEGDTKVIVFKTPAFQTDENKQIEEIVVYGDIELGTKYIAGTTGVYKFEINRGAYKAGPNAFYKTSIVVYTNRNIMWGGGGGGPISFDYQLGNGEETSYEKAEKKGKGQFITVNMQKDDFIIFVAIDGKGGFGDNEGRVYLSVTREK